MKLTTSAAAALAALVLVLVAASGAGCATSSAEIKQARASAYQTDFAIVFNACLEAVKAEGYDRIRVADGATGVIVTDWHKVDVVMDSQNTNWQQRGGTSNQAANFFRVRIQVAGDKPPYRLIVDGEAARYRPGFSQLFPFKHGAPDEPQWVNGRIDAIYTRVHVQLKGYAVTPSSDPAPADAPPAAAPADLSPPPEVPADGPSEPVAPAPAPAPAPTPDPAPAPAPGTP